jgi:hypothetical protein
VAKKEAIELQLPLEQIEYICAVAKLAGVSTGSTAAVLIAVQVLRWSEHRAEVKE